MATRRHVLLATAILLLPTTAATTLPTNAAPHTRPRQHTTESHDPHTRLSTRRNAAPSSRHHAKLRGGENDDDASDDVGGAADAHASSAPPAAAAAAATAAAPPPTTPKRARLSLASAAHELDASAVGLSAATLAALGLADGDTVLLTARRGRQLVGIALTDGGVDEGAVSLSAAAAASLKLTPGEGAAVASRVELDEAERVELCLVTESAAGYEGDAFDEALAPFLKGQGRPLTAGEVIETPVVGGAAGAEPRRLRWKVMGVDPEVDGAPSPSGIVGPATQVFAEGVISEEEALADSGVGYDDIGGLERQLAELREMVDLPLKQPGVFAAIGVRAPRGVLLHGPPGCGKTMVARAVESETGVFFKTVSGPEVMAKRPGDAEGALRAAFDEAERNAPAIVFIDELDALAPKRDKAQGELEKRVVAQLLTLMDGLRASRQVIVLGATAKPNAVDPALRRFGRFDRELALPSPDTEGRLSILRAKAAAMRLGADVDLGQVASDTHGYTGADLAQLVTEAAMACVRERAGAIDVDADDVDEETLEAMVVRPRHFAYAMGRTAPSSLRDKAVEIPDCSWDDVGGLLDVKREMVETLQYPLKYAAKYARYGLSPSKGVLLYGPSGCGKTLVAKAIANEVKSNFISVKGPELLSMWFGESESNVRELFNKARGAAPCILFFDEIDSIAKPRGSGGAGGGEAGDRIVNQILTEIDGVGAKKSVFIIAATNRPDMLDSAVMRPGRIDQLVYLPLPDGASRLAILRAATRKSPLAADVLLEDLAARTEGFSGADITEVCQRACKLAIRQNILESSRGDADPCAHIANAHFEDAMRTARKSVSEEDVKKFARFQASMRVGAA